MSEVASPPEADAGAERSGTPVVVVGIGHDGWEGLAPTSCAEIQRADVLMGSAHQLEQIPADVTAERVPWPVADDVEALPGLFDEHAGRAVVVLASGDPMYSGDRHDADPAARATSGCGCCPARRRSPWPAPGWAGRSRTSRWSASSAGRSSCCTRTCSPAAGCSSSVPTTTPRRRSRRCSPARGYGQSLITVLGGLGGPDEEVRSGTAATWSQRATALSITAVECRADRGHDAAADDARSARWRLRVRRAARPRRDPGDLPGPAGRRARSAAVGHRRRRPARSASSGCARTSRAGRSPSRPRRSGRSGSRATPPGWACRTCGWSRGEAPDVLSRLPEARRGVHRRRPDDAAAGGVLLGGAAVGRPAGGRGLPRGVRVGAPRPGTRGSAATWSGSPWSTPEKGSDGPAWIPVPRR